MNSFIPIKDIRNSNLYKEKKKEKAKEKEKENVKEKEKEKEKEIILSYYN